MAKVLVNRNAEHSRFPSHASPLQEAVCLFNLKRQHEAADPADASHAVRENTRR